ncbi:hypothetical protein CCR75_001466 [Bremia lactucae]|uniref:Uncharacterized protein n=1 Tax=Bremia lactucae TaxID=4779 RepID=A0A976IM94_BRELC|nr:hypothetical protein CCR75_001466 [Bremia lactucae]
MRLELNLGTRNWVCLLLVIQANLNLSPKVSLGGHAPIKFFACVPAPSLLRPLLYLMPRCRMTYLDRLNGQLQKLAEIHQEVVDRKQRKRLPGQGYCVQFCRWLFVLWSRVDKRMRGKKLLVRWVDPFVSRRLSTLDI